MSKIAVIATGGKQYKVKAKDVVKVEKLAKKEGEKVKFDTLLIADSDGSSLNLGKPKLKENVEGKVLSTEKDKKVKVVKYKNKIRYKRNLGHRQSKTSVEILDIA